VVKASRLASPIVGKNPLVEQIDLHLESGDYGALVSF